MHTAQSLVKESIDLISLPDVYIRLRNVINSPDSSMADIAQIIVHDPAITARLLKLVNSSFFGLVSRVDTMTHAINLLGTQQVHDLVLATVVIDSFSGFTNDSFNIYDFWFNSVYCAVTARLLAYHCEDLDTERPFIAGLLHDIGHLLSYQIIPDQSCQAINLSREKNMPLYLAERETLGFDYAETGSLLMKEWQLPDSLREITRYQNEPEQAVNFKLETSILHIATAITHNALNDIDISPDTLRVQADSWQLTGLSAGDMAELKKDVDQQASMAMNMLFSNRRKSA